jgi:hypothetical protein
VGVADQGEHKIEMVALDESEWERTNVFGWKWVPKTRLLVADKNKLEGDTEEASAGYEALVIRDGMTATADAEGWVQPSIGGKQLDEVPFIFVNANDLVPDPEDPPLLGLANIGLCLYRSDADYRHTLFLQGQATFVMIGADDRTPELRLGAGAIVDLPKGSDAKYVQVLADGINGQENAISNLLQQASDRGAKLLDFDAGNNQISGEALRVRVAARTTTLTSVAITSAEALKKCLKLIARWMGLNEDEVSVKPNLEFSDSTFTGQDLLNYVQAKNLGAPISVQTIHAMMRRRDVTDLSFEEEKDLLDAEEPLPGSAALAEEHLDAEEDLAREGLEVQKKGVEGKLKNDATKIQQKPGQSGKPNPQAKPAPRQNSSSKKR